MTKDCLDDYLDKCCETRSSNEFLTDIRNKVEEYRKNDKFQHECEIHNALSNQTRLEIYKIIQEMEICSCVLARIFKLSKGTMSHHIKILEEANLIIGRKSGYFTIYYSVENFKAKFL